MIIEENVEGKDLEKILTFLKEKADKVSVERYCDERIPDEEFEIVQKEYLEYIKEEDKKRRQRYCKDEVYRRQLNRIGIKNESEVQVYFDDLFEQDIDVATSITNDGKERIVNEISTDVIEKRYTRVTNTTQGPLMQQYFLKVGEVLNSIQCELKKLFDFPYVINGEEYENLTFYIKEDPIFSICSHEQFANISLDIISSEELRKFGINFVSDELDK